MFLAALAWTTIESKVVPDAIRHENGRALIGGLSREAVRTISDFESNPAGSNTYLDEDTVHQNQSHASHKANRLQGEGRRSDRGGLLWLSPSAGADLRNNGRTYHVSRSSETPSAFLALVWVHTLSAGLSLLRRNVIRRFRSLQARVHWLFARGGAISATAGGVLAVFGIGSWTYLLYEQHHAQPIVLQIDAVKVAHESGLAFVVNLDSITAFPLEIQGDSMTAARASLTRLKEDGKELGPPHSVHSEIRRVGTGMFSHWGSSLYFSSTDGRDPRTNGLAYAVELHPRVWPVLWLVFGAAALIGILIAVPRAGVALSAMVRNTSPGLPCGP